MERACPEALRWEGPGEQGGGQNDGAEGGKGRTGQSTRWELGGKSCEPCNQSVLVTFTVTELLFLFDVLSDLSRMLNLSLLKAGLLLYRNNQFNLPCPAQFLASS